ncbi:TPA: ribonuclease P [Candidatus Woesearchaeota archaeon]|nr:Ribonuclease P protein component 4 [archaeon GW2011_AR15]MBS3103608.1 ribonuclease P [Candidatus Woesearchaeota archaeon]HIH41792.1 ribonuclease P [Candidatus Woesearchaeota archaeon]
MKRPHSKKSGQLKEIALERINELFSQAEKVFRKSPDLADRYVELARKIGMKYKVTMPRQHKRRFCKHCYTYLVPGANCRVRLTGQKVVYFCHKCRNYMRFPYSPAKTK